MAITYTYSFNCTIKYRLSGETGEATSPLLSDSTNLYTCTSTLAPTIDKDKKLTVTKPADFILPLPNYLQGVGDGINWYLNRDKNNVHSNNVTSGKLNNKDLVFENWIIKNAVQTGTFISCDATIILFTDSGQKTIQWKYKKLTDGKIKEDVYNTSTTWQPILTELEQQQFISANAPKIDSWFSEDSQDSDKATLYVFTGWSELVTTDNITYICTANYTETTYDKANPYTVSNKNIFTDAEPYHYGTGTPNDGWFVPIGEDNDDATINDIKVQAPENNGYSVIKPIEGYKIKGKSVQYIEKGTFPLTKNKIYSTLPSVESTQRYIYMAITYTKVAEGTIPEIDHIDILTSGSNKTKVSGIQSLFADGTVTLALSNKDPFWATRGHPGKFPKKLGFILTGAGGGCAGISRIDPKKDGKENDYTIPGGGGGGGEIVTGVLDLSYIEEDALVSEEITAENNEKQVIYQKIYKFTLGGGGTGGSDWQNNVDYENPEYGGHGSNGDNSKIEIVKINSNESEDDLIKLYTIGGGKGGRGGTECTGGAGGNLISDSSLRKNSHGCVLCQHFKGGNGAGVISGNTAQNQALDLTLYFGVVPPSADCCIHISHEAISYTHDPSQIIQDSGIAGGHSFGSGGKWSGASPVDPKFGGGGGGGYNEDDWYAGGNLKGQSGARGYFGLYY